MARSNSPKVIEGNGRPVNWLTHTPPETQTHEEHMAAVRRSKSEHEAAMAHQNSINKSKIGALMAHLSAELDSMPEKETDLEQADYPHLPVPDVDMSKTYSDEVKRNTREYFLREDKRHIASRLADEDSALPEEWFGYTSHMVGILPRSSQGRDSKVIGDSMEQLELMERMAKVKAELARKTAEREAKSSNAASHVGIGALLCTPQKEKALLPPSPERVKKWLSRPEFRKRYFWEKEGIMKSVFAGEDKDDDEDDHLPQKRSPASSVSSPDSSVRRSQRTSRPSPKVVENNSSGSSGSERPARKRKRSSFSQEGEEAPRRSKRTRAADSAQSSPGS